MSGSGHPLERIHSTWTGFITELRLACKSILRACQVTCTCYACECSQESCSQSFHVPMIFSGILYLPAGLLTSLGHTRSQSMECAMRHHTEDPQRLPCPRSCAVNTKMLHTNENLATLFVHAISAGCGLLQRLPPVLFNASLHVHLPGSLQG